MPTRGEDRHVDDVISGIHEDDVSTADVLATPGDVVADDDKHASFKRSGLIVRLTLPVVEVLLRTIQISRVGGHVAAPTQVGLGQIASVNFNSDALIGVVVT